MALDIALGIVGAVLILAFAPLAIAVLIAALPLIIGAIVVTGAAIWIHDDMPGLWEDLWVIAGWTVLAITAFGWLPSRLRYLAGKAAGRLVLWWRRRGLY